jgi:hypothetical protein
MNDKYECVKPGRDLVTLRNRKQPHVARGQLFQRAMERLERGQELDPTSTHEQ